MRVLPAPSPLQSSWRPRAAAAPNPPYRWFLSQPYWSFSAPDTCVWEGVGHACVSQVLGWHLVVQFVRPPLPCLEWLGLPWGGIACRRAGGGRASPH